MPRATCSWSEARRVLSPFKREAKFGKWLIIWPEPTGLASRHANYLDSMDPEGHLVIVADAKGPGEPPPCLL